VLGFVERIVDFEGFSFGTEYVLCAASVNARKPVVVCRADAVDALLRCSINWMFSWQRACADGCPLSACLSDAATKPTAGPEGQFSAALQTLFRATANAYK